MLPVHISRAANLTRFSLLISLIACAAFAPRHAAAATQCTNAAPPAPMQICVYDDSSPAVWVNQLGASVAQYWQDSSGPFSWGSVIWLGSNRYATTYARMYPDLDLAHPNYPGFTPVSNTKTGSGTVADPIVITTTVMLGSTNVQFTQRVTYVNGDRLVRKTWTLTNNGTNTYTNVRLFHGGDATFGGIDDARSWYDPVNKMVYLTNKEFDVSGYMGSYANPATPAAAYFAGFIFADSSHPSAGYDQVLSEGQLSNEASPEYQDAGYFLQWNREELAPGDAWTVEAFDYWSPPGKLQMFAPADDHAVPGGTLSRKFNVQNLDDTHSVTVDLQATAPGGWTVEIEGATSITLAPLEIAEIPVTIGVPSGATSGSTASITLSASVGGSPSASAAMRVNVIVPEYTITPSSLTFPATAPGSSSDLEVQVENGSGAPAVTFGSTPALTAPFSIVADECSDATLAAGASCSITVRYAPTGAGSSSGTLSLSVLAPDIVVHSIPLAGSSLVSYTVTASAGTGGTISPTSTSVVQGQTATFTITPNAGYEIASVSGCSGSLSGNTYTTGAITAACTVNATFSLKQYTVTASAGAGGSISPTSMSVTHGQTATFTITPNVGYAIASVSGCSGTLSGNTYTTGAITAACAVNATFTQKKYTVTASAGTGGSISPASTSVPHGQTATFTITPNEGYGIASVSGCSGTLSGNIYTTGAITAACAVSATFTEKHYTVTASAGTGGSISPASTSVAHGQTATFTLTPDEGYEVASVSGCSGTLSGNTYTTSAITAACAVNATFTRKQYTVTASAGPGGTVSPTHITVGHGESATFTATPDPDYEIASFSGCDGVRDGSKLTVVVTASCTVSATFNKIKSPLPVFNFEHTRPDGTPEPLSVASTGLFTALPEIVAPKAYDADGNELPVTLVDALDRYPPGAHVITWRTEDSQGHVATATQALYVWPTVSFGPDITIGGEAGNYAFFRVALNGRAPLYPLMVNYTAHGDLEGHDLQSGTVVFEEGEIEKEIGFAIQSTLPADAADRQVQLTFDDGVNRGSNRPLTVTITALNAPPGVRLALSQAGESTTVVTRDRGPATLSLDILDPNTTQTHTVQWIAPTGTDFTIAGNSLVLQPGSLPPGVHRFEAIVTDSGAPPGITRAHFEVVVRETTAALPAGATELLESGMPNHGDYTPEPPNVLPERERELHHYLMEADPGTRLALGPYSQLRALYQTELEGPPAPNEWPADTVPNVGGYFDFVVADLPRVGDTVNVVIPQRAAIPANGGVSQAQRGHSPVAGLRAKHDQQPCVCAGLARLLSATLEHRVSRGTQRGRLVRAPDARGRQPER